MEKYKICLQIPHAIFKALEAPLSGITFIRNLDSRICVLLTFPWKSCLKKSVFQSFLGVWLHVYVCVCELIGFVLGLIKYEVILP